jgi:UDP-N-acetylmuramate dehydrogenase
MLRHERVSLEQAPLAVARDLAALDVGRVERDADLSKLSWWRIGGRADLLVEPRSPSAAQGVLRYLARAGIPRIVIGDGSNLLFDDAGLRGVVVRIGRSLNGMRVRLGTVSAGAGLYVPRFVRKLGSLGLSGLEHAIGIPGTLGGLVVMNGGSQRKSIGSVVVKVSGCDLSGEPFEHDHAACRFRYRGSRLNDDGLVVLETTLALHQGDPAAMRREMIGIMAERRRKFLKDQPNCGSVFVSDPAMYATVGPPGAAIERVGLKGARFGGAEISPRHANFIVNLGGARSADVLSLIALARDRVRAATGFAMACEVRHVSPDGRIRPAHVTADERSASPRPGAFTLSA